MFQTTLIRIPRFGISRGLTYLAAVCFGFGASDLGFTRGFISDFDIRISDFCFGTNAEKALNTNP